MFERLDQIEVRYEELTPILLNEVQRQRKEISTLVAQLHDLQQTPTQVNDLQRQLTQLKESVQAARFSYASSYNVLVQSEPSAVELPLSSAR